jgi:hypothetical protein
LNLEPSVFAGDSNDALARVYAALPRAGLPEGARLEGELIGPYCRHSQTLPARIRFVDRGPGPTLLLEATVPDPCFWTPELPFIYSLKLRAILGDETIVAIRQPLGIRRLGIQGTSLFLDAKRFVLRGVRREAPRLADLALAREAASALFVADPSDQFLKEASEEGVWLAVELRSGQLTAEIARVGRWPAVAVVVLDCNLSASKELRQAARNTLFAENVVVSGPAFKPAPWSHLLWCPIGNGATPAVVYGDMPIIAYRPTSENATIELGRRACDRLQADLATLGDYAGYFTG